MSNLDDGGIIKQYADAFRHIAISAAGGEDVCERQRVLVESVVRYIDTWRDAGSASHIIKLISRLQLQADLLGQTAPEQAHVLNDAARRLGDHVNRRDEGQS